MAFESRFTTIELDELLEVTRAKREGGYRFVQMLCTMTDDGVDLVYSFMGRHDDCSWVMENYKICSLDRETQTVPSVTGYFLSAFPFENEAHDLFGVNVEGNAIDFAGNFYQVSMDVPMSVISPEQKAAREKAAKAAAAKAARETKAKAAKEAKEAEAKKKAAAASADKAAEDQDESDASAAQPASDDTETTSAPESQPEGNNEQAAGDAAKKGGE